MSSDSLDSKKAKKPNNYNVFDQFHAYKVCAIPATRAKEVDVMKQYRPKRRDMAQLKDYELTQAYTIMDRDPVKILFRDTECTYKFHPPGFVGNKHLRADARGHGPLDKLLLEEFQDVIDYYQQIAHYNLKCERAARIAKFKKEHIRIKKMFSHNMGPDWFQELSSVQREAIDNLATAIVTDLSKGSIDNTQYIIAKLGLVLRPNHVLVKKALELSESCPVEFLLVLYQLINSNRTQYSINDRLLLSAVTHLTLRSTLKELHVRIPSPPRAPPKPPPKEKEKPKGPARSPYLEDLLLRDPVPRRNFHAPSRFYANSVYFDYVFQMQVNNILLRTLADGDTRRDFQYEKTYSGGVCTCDNCSFPDCAAAKDLDAFTRIEIDLITEWTRAQKYYNSLSNTKCVAALFKPSVYVCPIGKFRPYSKATSRTTSEAITPDTSKEATITEEVLKKCLCKSPAIAPSQISLAKSTTQTLDITDTEPGCICSIDEYLLNEEEEGDVFWSEPSTPPPDPCADINVPTENEQLLSVKTVESATCACKEAILKRIDESLCHCERCEDDRRRRNSFIKYVIADMKESPDKPIAIIKDCQAKPICTCMEKYKKRWERFERIHGIRKVQAALKSLDEKFVINGTAIGPDGKIVYILSSVMPKRCCQCARIKEMEEEDKRTLKRMPMLPGGCIKYHIAGVQERPEGNVYVVAGTTENTECDCMSLYERFMREHFLCMKLYKEYMKKIAYDTEEYLKELDSEYCDFEASAAWTDNEVEVVEKSCPCHCDRGTQVCCCHCQCTSDMNDSVDCICSVQSCPCGFDQCECITEEGLATDDSLFEGTGECECSLISDASNQEGGASNASNCACTTFTGQQTSRNSQISNRAPSARSSMKTTASKSTHDVLRDEADDTDSLFERIKEEYKQHPLYKVEDPPELERYMILKKLPTTRREQTAVLKKALKKLAEDGFPLARLPDVHKLPIFQAWWRFRLRHYYTANERCTLLNSDMALLDRMDCLRPHIGTIKNTFLKDRMDMHNWDHHSFIKKYNTWERSDYCHKNREISINYARGMYTIMRMYDLPNKTFHDVFFAYMPSKEEDIFMDQIWKSNELKHKVK